MFIDSEELARPRQVGVRVHQTIAALAATTRQPTPAELMRAANNTMAEFRPIEARGHRQNIVGLVAAYFWHLLPPPQWVLAGSELSLGTGRIDLLWRDSGGRLLIDELKTGAARRLALERTHAQARRYADLAFELWGEQFLGVRLLCLTEPRKALFLDRHGAIQSLHQTPYLEKKGS